jgi:hypothetical protein
MCIEKSSAVVYHYQYKQVFFRFLFPICRECDAIVTGVSCCMLDLLMTNISIVVRYLLPAESSFSYDNDRWDIGRRQQSSIVNLCLHAYLGMKILPLFHGINKEIIKKR